MKIGGIMWSVLITSVSMLSVIKMSVKVPCIYNLYSWMFTSKT
jgi:hypothetical protein